MLVCKSCNIEYEEGKKYCKHCGDSLVPKEESFAIQKKIKKAEEENSDGKLICPVCKIVYEFGSSCIQCGSPLEHQITAGAKDESDAARGTKPEEKGPPVQPIQGEEIEAFRAGLICPVCKIAYERGDFCSECGSALLPQIPSQAKEALKTPPSSEATGKPLQAQGIQEQVAEAPRKKLICPTCGIIYERGSSCIRCGSSLVPQTPSQKKEKPQSSDAEVAPSTSPPKDSEELSKMDLDQTFVAAPEHPPLSSPKEQKPVVIQQGNRKEIGPSLEEELFRDISLEQQPSKKTSDQAEKKVNSLKKPKRDYRRLFLEVGGVAVMALAGGYFLWSVFFHLTAKQPESKALPPKETVSQTLPASSSASNPVQTATESGGLKSGEESSTPSKETPPTPLRDDSKTASTEAREIRSIKALLEHIRQANLQKNIDLFISCYASDFRNLDARKRATLAYWDKFNYVDLSYDLKDPSISAETARAKVEWLIKTSSKAGGRPQENRSILDVRFKKEDGGWRITEVKIAK